MTRKLRSQQQQDSESTAFIAALLERRFSGECSEALGDRLVLATDNSIYQRCPQAVLFPKTTEDLVRIANLAAEPRFEGVHFAARGGGTGTNAQSLTDGIVVDVSRHMTAILEINADERWVKVQPGVVKDQLNVALRPYDLFFAPELSTSNRATIGGMISTDACGQGSCLYGKTRNHVLEISSVLLGGDEWTSKPLTESELAAAKKQPGRIGEIHRALDDIHVRYRDLIEERFPNLNRSLTGYDLAHLRTADGRFDLNAILCGSEGTLAFIAEAKLAVLPLPKHSALLNVRYSSFDAALRDATFLMRLKPASIETVDALVLDLGRNDIIWKSVERFFPDAPDAGASAVNIVEFLSDDEYDLKRQIDAAEKRLRDDGNAARLGHTVAYGKAATKAVWGMRKRAAGLLGNVPGEQRPVPFVEDTAVPPERLADYIAEFRTVLDRRGLSYGMFGHVDAGVLHVRPALDMKDPVQAAQVREITEEVVALTLKYGGLLWGEHGKGVRSEFAPEFFGPLYPALQQVKAAFDPHEQMNPGKLASVSGGLLRVDGVETRGQNDRKIPPAVRARFDGALHCNGNGACFNFDPDDQMCPSFKATRDRRHSPKGRAALMREWLRLQSLAGIDPLANARNLRARSGLFQLPTRIWNSLRKPIAPEFSHDVKAAMDGCLACKACVGQCPVRVDVPDMRAAFLEIYYGQFLRPSRHLVMAYLEHILPTLAKAPALYNSFVASGLGKAVMHAMGIVEVPKLEQREKHRLLNVGPRIATPSRIRAMSNSERAKSVILVQDAFTTHFETGLVHDLAAFLERIGYKLLLAPYRPNGKPLHVSGLLGAFERVARRNVAMLNELAATGIPMIGLDPSMTLTFRSEYKRALPQESVPVVMLLQEWLASLSLSEPSPREHKRFWLLPHCTERTNASGSLDDWQRIFRKFGHELTILPSGCCGMAGMYGHEASNRSTSELIYTQSWRKYVTDSALSEVLVATGYSCRSQAALIDGARLQHPVQALLNAA